MAIPVTVSQVRPVLPSNGQSSDDTQIQASIDVANSLISEMVDGCLLGFSDARVENIEIQLAAHFAVMSNPSLAVIEESIDGKSRLRYGNGNQNQNSVLGTQYGRNANSLSGGCLAQYEKTPPRIYSVGSIGE